MTKNYQLKTLDDTKTLAQALSKIAEPNLYLLFTGDLASGKTQLAKFIATELGVQEVVNSPTFVILNEYQTNYDWKLIHIDAYRLDEETDFTEYFELTIGNFTIIEWPEKVNWDFQSLQTVSIKFELQNDIRELTLTTNNLSAEKEQILNELK